MIKNQQSIKQQAAPTAAAQDSKQKKNHSQPRQKSAPKETKPEENNTQFKKLQQNMDFFSTLYKKGERLARDQEQAYYQKLQKDNKEGDYLLKMLKQGTITDKISALSLLIQREPVRSLTYLKSLLNLSKKKNRKQAESSIGALRDLFTQHGLLREDRRLYPFSKNPILQNKKESEIKDKELLEAYFEHQIKELYKEFVTQVLQPLTHDDLEFFKKFSLTVLESLIERKSEMEDVILGIIVNKLGDLSKKIQCHTIFTLIKLTQVHKEMSEVIVREVQLFIQRPGTKNNQIYYASAYLNRVASMVAPKDEKVRISLFRIYFSLFKKIVGTFDKKEDVAKKPVVEVKKDRTKSKEQRIKEQKLAEKTGKIDQSNNRVAEIVLKGVNVLMVKCSDMDLMSNSNSELRKLIEEETNILFQLTHHESFKIQIQTLKLLFAFAKQTNKINKQEIQIAKQDQPEGQTNLASFSDRYYRSLYEILLKLHLTKAAKLDEFFSLVFKSIKIDKNIPRIMAFFRRMLQMCFINEAGFTAATLLIISELIKSKDDLKFSLYSFDVARMGGRVSRTQVLNNNDSDEEERFYDVDKLQDEQQKQIVQGKKVNANGQSQSYDALKREPQYANADQSPLFELHNLTFHSHPTIQLWAKKLVNGESIFYAGDPLLDFGLANFLDRISYKNPKSAEKLAKIRGNQRMSALEAPINTYDFTSENKDNLPTQVREEEKYMYKYFKEKPIKEKKKGGAESDLEFDEDEEDPEMEKFAQQVMEKEMKRMNQGMGEEDLEDEDDDMLEQLDGEDNEEGEEDMDEDEENEDFFDGEELSDVEIEGDKEDKEGEDDSEVEMDNEEEMADEYGGEDDEEFEEDDENLFDQIKSNKKGNDKKDAKQKSSIYADYDEFATLLEQDLYSEDKAKKYLGSTGQKRPRSQRGGPKRGGGGASRGGAGASRGGSSASRGGKRQRTK